MSVKFATSPEEVFKKNGAEPLIKLLLKGIQGEIKLKVWRRVNEELFKMINEPKIEEILKDVPLFKDNLPPFFLKVEENQGTLEIKVTEQVTQKLLQELPEDAPQLIKTSSTVKSSKDIPKHLTSLGIPEWMVVMFKDVMNNLDDEIEISVCHPQMALKVKINGQGLHLILKNLAKCIPNAK